MKKQKNNDGGLVYSTNKELMNNHFAALANLASTENENTEPTKQNLIVRLETKHRAGKAVTMVLGFAGTENEMEDLCKHCSAQEKKATEAERDSIKYKQAEFLKTQVGQVKEGIISGVTSFGVFVELLDSKCEGMVSLRKMDEPYEYDERTLTVTAKFTGKQYTLGDKVKVIISAANPEKKEVDLMFVE